MEKETRMLKDKNENIVYKAEKSVANKRKECYN